MLRISKITDYGVVLCTHLAAAEGGGARNVRDLAADTRIPQPTAAKVLKRLGRAGLVESQRGAHGGYRLARAPERVTIAELIAALEGPIAVTECSTEETAGVCDFEGSCEVQINWQQINSAVEGALSSITLADMTKPSAPRLVSLARSAGEAERLRQAGDRPSG